MAEHTDKPLSLDGIEVDFAFTVAALDAIELKQYEFEFQGYIVETITAMEVLDEMVRTNTIH